MPRVPFPTSYAACRDDFRASTEHAGAAATGTPIAATGPDGLGLTIDVAVLDPPSPERALFVMAGVHGVEGLTASPIMSDALSRRGERDLPLGVGIVFVHAVNPWGMAWLRRQNESDVDLDRNWAAGTTQGTDDNPGDPTLHDILCPGGPTPPSPEWFLDPVSPHSASPPHTTTSSSISTPGSGRTATRHCWRVTRSTRRATGGPAPRFQAPSWSTPFAPGAHRGAASSRADWPTWCRRPPSTP